MIRIDSIWLATEPMDMRAGKFTAGTWGNSKNEPGTQLFLLNF